MATGAKGGCGSSRDATRSATGAIRRRQGDDQGRLARYRRRDEVDADGYLWFCGRRKQIIVHDGSNICPQEVEDALIEHPAVAGAGVVGIHDLVHGENVRPSSRSRRTPAPDLARADRIRPRRVGYKAPEDIVVLDAMPLNRPARSIASP